MYRLLIFFLLLLGASPLSSFGDTGTTLISGKVVDSLSRKGVPFVTVTVQNAQSKVLKRLASDANGTFEFSLKENLKGEVVISAVGYNPVRVKFAAGSKSKESLGSIMMSEASAKLGQVVVQAQKQLVKIDVDKISYNTDADPEAQTSNALDMLRKVPLVTVDGEDNITLKGSSSFKILVNGKESTLMSSSPKDILKGMPASSIKNVEVITNPSSKYSAEGVGGIINIVTTKKTLEGVTGNVNLRADNIGGFGGSIYTTAKIGKFSFSVNYGPNRRKEKESTSSSIMENFLSPTNHRTETFSSSNGSSYSHFGSGEMSYEIDSLNLISMSFWGYGGKWKSNPDGITSVYDDQGVLFQQFNQQNTYKRTFGSMSGNLDYQRSFKKPDKLFTVSYKLDYNPSGTENEYEVKGIKNYTDIQNKSKNDAASYEHTFQVDFVNPITERHQYEVGTKYILRTNPSETDYYNFVNSDWVDDPTRYNKLTYTQNIVAAYAGYLYKMKKVSLKTGFRLEGAYTDANSKQGVATKTPFNNNVTDVVPYFTLSYKLAESSSVKFNYTQRLQRPGIWYLNPYVDDSKPKMISYGNPNLKTEKVNAFDISYSYFSGKANLEAGLSTRLNDNAIQSIISVRSDGVQVQTYENSGINNSFGGNLYGSYRPWSILSLDIHGETSYSIMERNSNGEKLRKEGWETYMGGSIRWTIIKGLSLSTYGGGSTGWLQLQGKSKGFFYNGVSLRKDLLKSKMNVSISVSNPFQEYRTWKSDMRDDTFSSHNENRSLNRTFSFGISYRFGKMGAMVKKAQRGINNDDVKSGGSKGGNGGGGN